MTTRHHGVIVSRRTSGGGPTAVRLASPATDMAGARDITRQIAVPVSGPAHPVPVATRRGMNCSDVRTLTPKVLVLMAGNVGVPPPPRRGVVDAGRRTP